MKWWPNIFVTMVSAISNWNVLQNDRDSTHSSFSSLLRAVDRDELNNIKYTLCHSHFTQNFFLHFNTTKTNNFILIGLTNVWCLLSSSSQMLFKYLITCIYSQPEYFSENAFIALTKSDTICFFGSQQVPIISVPTEWKILPSSKNNSLHNWQQLLSIFLCSLKVILILLLGSGTETSMNRSGNRVPEPEPQETESFFSVLERKPQGTGPQFRVLKPKPQGTGSSNSFRAPNQVEQQKKIMPVPSPACI